MRFFNTFLFTLVAAILFSIAASAKPAELKLAIQKNDVDLATRTLHFKLNQPAAMAELQVFDLNGSLLAEKLEMFDGAKAGTKLSITWPLIIDDPENFRIALKVTDINDYWTAFEIVHFYGTIPHEEVVFESGKSEILASEAPKLDAAIPQIVEMINKFKKFASQMTYNLYVAGYTDTVGNNADNRQLSQDRARAIARYFQDHGLKKEKITILVRGFGEEVLAVSTKDNVDEVRNRRADYIVSNFPPAIGGPGAWIPVQK